MNDYSVLLGEKIKLLRKNLNITQEFLAEKVDRSKNHISKIEQGAANPPLSLIIDIAAALNVEPQELFDFDGLVLYKNKTIQSEFKKVIEISNERHLKLLFKIHKDLLEA